MGAVIGVNRRNLAALAAAGTVLTVAYLLLGDPIAQYGGWLVVFVVWMVWFVLAGIEWLSQADY